VKIVVLSVPYVGQLLKSQIRTAETHAKINRSLHPSNSGLQYVEKYFKQTL